MVVGSLSVPSVFETYIEVTEETGPLDLYVLHQMGANVANIWLGMDTGIPRAAGCHRSLLWVRRPGASCTTVTAALLCSVAVRQKLLLVAPQRPCGRGAAPQALRCCESDF